MHTIAIEVPDEGEEAPRIYIQPNIGLSGKLWWVFRPADHNGKRVLGRCLNLPLGLVAAQGEWIEVPADYAVKLAFELRRAGVDLTDKLPPELATALGEP